MDMNKQNAMMSALNRLCKWRSILAGWQMGTRSNTDESMKALKDHREVSLIMRAECSAFTMLLIKKGVFTEDEWNDQMLIEARQLNASLERRFPGIRSSDVGIVLTNEAVETMKNWPK